MSQPDPSPPSPGLDRQAQLGARVAGRLADAIPHGPAATMAVGRAFTTDEILCGLSFLATVMEIASVSSKTLAEVQKERMAAATERPGRPRPTRRGWN